MNPLDFVVFGVVASSTTLTLGFLSGSPIVVGLFAGMWSLQFLIIADEEKEQEQ